MIAFALLCAAVLAFDTFFPPITAQHQHPRSMNMKTLTRAARAVQRYAEGIALAILGGAR